MSPVLTNLSEKKRQKYLVIVFFIILFISFIILARFFKKPKISLPKTLMASEYKEPQINFQILENPFFKMLRPFEIIPPYKGASGRENPFLPF